MPYFIVLPRSQASDGAINEPEELRREDNEKDCDLMAIILEDQAANQEVESDQQTQQQTNYLAKLEEQYQLVLKQMRLTFFNTHHEALMEMRKEQEKRNNKKETDDFVLNIIAIGDCDVGKAALLLRYAGDVLPTKFISSIGIDFKIRRLHIESPSESSSPTQTLDVKLRIQDTACQERFRTITTGQFYRAN